MATQIQSLTPGHTINEYRFDRLLGVGGFGLTYLATDQNLNLPVAIKEYLPSDIATRDEDSSIRPSSEENKPTFEWGLTRFLEEARTLAAFHHPNIVRVMRFFQANATAYMVMEYVQGAPLSDWIKPRRPLPQSAIENIILPLVEGLGVIHKHGYLHRDVKPGNIYIRTDGSPVLLDFGAARSTQGGGELTAIVSPGYAPVEQYSESSAQGPWSDLYAIGGVMYWLVTGQKPVDATARIRNDPLPAAVSIGDKSHYQADFLAAIDWALNPDERLRPQSGGEFLARFSGRGVSSRNDDARTQPVPQEEKTVPAAFLQTMTGLTGLLLDREELKRVEAELATFIGPLAQVLVRKAAKTATSMEAVINALAPEIENEDDRAAFFKRVKNLKGNTQPPSSPSRPGLRADGEVATQLAAARFSMEVLERAEKRLAQHIGAIARVIVKKAAMKARDEGELYLIMADEIEDPVERKAFVKKAIAAAGKS